MSKQTAVEWLDRWFRDNPEATHEEGYKALEQAKQMEKHQMFGFTNHHHVIGEGTERFFKEEFELWYNETYGSNHIGDTNEMIDHIGDANKMVEISDEEIIKLANEHILYNDSKRQWIIEGMKLYKEQLKRGNNE